MRSICALYKCSDDPGLDPVLSQLNHQKRTAHLHKPNMDHTANTNLFYCNRTRIFEWLQGVEMDAPAIPPKSSLRRTLSGNMGSENFRFDGANWFDRNQGTTFPSYAQVARRGLQLTSQTFSPAQSTQHADIAE